ncbi:MAG: hypothetical protein IJT60_03285 [Clostridia bacterium]|nr:hypothetical protein [Clostridia bacterium]
MKHAIKILCFVLLLAMIVSAFAACGGAGSDQPGKETQVGKTGDETQKSGTGESESGSTETESDDGFPRTYDWGYETVKFLCWQRPDWNPVRTMHDIVSIGLTGDLVGDAVYYRNEEVKERYKVNIEMELQHQNTVPNTIKNQVASGTHEWDVLYPRLYEAATLILGGNFLNLLDAPNLRLEKPWWDQNCKEVLTICDGLYYCATDLNVNDKDGTAALAFNKQEQQNNPGLDDFYKLVAEGTWTMDRLIENASIAARDDGNEVMDVNDFWGFIGGKDVVISFYHGSGSTIVSKTDPDTYTLTLGTERDIDVIDEIVEIFEADKTWFFNHHSRGLDDNAYSQLFTSGHGLFFWMRLDEVTNMRGTEFDFGILPTPKYDEDQDHYYSLVSPHICAIMSLPSTSVGDSLERTTMVVEAMSEISHGDLRNAYVEQSLKYKFSRDEESSVSVGLILDNRVFDPGFLYDFGPLREQIQVMGTSYKSLTVLMEQYRTATETNIYNFLFDLEEMQADFG